MLSAKGNQYNKGNVLSKARKIITGKYSLGPKHHYNLIISVTMKPCFKIMWTHILTVASPIFLLLHQIIALKIVIFKKILFYLVKPYR